MQRRNDAVRQRPEALVGARRVGVPEDALKPLDQLLVLCIDGSGYGIDLSETMLEHRALVEDALELLTADLEDQLHARGPRAPHAANDSRVANATGGESWFCEHAFDGKNGAPWERQRECGRDGGVRGGEARKPS